MGKLKPCPRCGREGGIVHCPNCHVTPELIKDLKRFDYTQRDLERHRMFLEIAAVISKQSTCNRGSIGCVIVQDRRIVSTGYNGAPSGQPHCTEVGCEELILWDPIDEDFRDFRDINLGCQRSIHAETNAVVFAAKFGVSVDGASMYSTHSPCYTCAKLIVASGIKSFYYTNSYRAERLDVLTDAGITINH